MDLLNKDYEVSRTKMQNLKNYNQCAEEIISCCKKNDIEYHTKEGNNSIKLLRNID